MLHGTDARWFRATERAIMLEEKRHFWLFVLTAIAENEADGKAGELVLPADDAEMPDFDVVDVDTDEEDVEQGRQPRLLGSYAAAAARAIQNATPEKIRAQIDLTGSQYKFYKLLEHMNGRAPTDDTVFASQSCSFYQICRQMVNPLASPYVGITTPVFQSWLASNRELLYSNFIAETLSHAGTSATHDAYMTKLLNPIANAYFFECWDPQHGMWESYCMRGAETDSEGLAHLGENAPFPLSVFCKKAIAETIRGELELVGNQISAICEARPMFEKEQESQFREGMTFKTKMRKDQSNYSKTGAPAGGDRGSLSAPVDAGGYPLGELRPGFGGPRAECPGFCPAWLRPRRRHCERNAEGGGSRWPAVCGRQLQVPNRAASRVEKPDEQVETAALGPGGRFSGAVQEGDRLGGTSELHVFLRARGWLPRRNGGLRDQGKGRSCHARVQRAGLRPHGRAPGIRREDPPARCRNPRQEWSGDRRHGAEGRVLVRTRTRQASRPRVPRSLFLSHEARGCGLPLRNPPPNQRAAEGVQSDDAQGRVRDRPGGGLRR
mmetsp:Transcript_17939/g.44792  ORF Transcript_17939/g.44792 Transcript_17939/m.44792 type:complete len:551 (+) Transcript_17939:191-1843(+)